MPPVKLTLWTLARAFVFVPLFMLFGPVYFFLCAVRWVQILLYACSRSLSNFLRLVFLSIDEILFWINLIPTGLRLMWLYPSIQSRVYTTFKGKEMMCDIYNPDDCHAVNSTERRPVIVFIYGGAWCSGGRLFYGLMAKRLSRVLGAFVVVPDYAYYPEASMVEMALQMTSVDAFVRAEFELRASSFHWMGHSAGAHLVLLSALRRQLAGCSVAHDLFSGDPDPPQAPLFSWDPFTSLHVREAAENPPPPASVHFDEFVPASKPASLILLAGVYDIRDHLEWETARSVNLLSGMKNSTHGHYESNSPACIVEEMLRTQGASKAKVLLSSFPPVFLFHGSRDLTVPASQSLYMHSLLKSVGVRSTEQHRFPMGHIDFINHFHEAEPSPLVKEVRKIFEKTASKAS